MEIVESLSQKVRQAASRIKTLENENARMAEEVDHLKLQLKHYHELNRENDAMKKNQDAVRGRLVKLQKKLEKQLVLSIDAPTSTPTEVSHEESVQ